MSRTLTGTVSSAILADATRPIYLVQIAFDTVRREATWDENISWNGQTWLASGISVSDLSTRGCVLEMPNGDSDPWLNLVQTDGTRGRAILIYEHHYDDASSPQEDAVLVFSGIMDEWEVTDNISVKVVEASRAKTFPPASIEEPTFTHLLTSGDQITWGNDTITVT